MPEGLNNKEDVIQIFFLTIWLDFIFLPENHYLVYDLTWDIFKIWPELLESK